MILHTELGTFYVWRSNKSLCSSMDKSKRQQLYSQLHVYNISNLGNDNNLSIIFWDKKQQKKFGFKLTIGCESFLISLAFLIISFIQDINGFIAIYCIMVGISGGLLYMLPIICGWRYFPKRRGMVQGFIIAGYGFGSFIFNYISKAIANPNNLQPSVEVIEDGKVVKYFSIEVAKNVPFMFQVLSISYVSLGIIGTLMIRFPQDIDPDKMLATLEAQEQKNKKEYDDSLSLSILLVHKECQSLIYGIKSKAFILLQLVVLMSCTLGMLISNCYKLYGLEIGIDDAMLTTTGSAAGVMNGLLRFFWATLTDNPSYKFTFTLISILNLVTSSLLPYNTNGIEYLLLIGVVCLAEGGLLATYPVICTKVYGRSSDNLKRKIRN